MFEPTAASCTAASSLQYHAQQHHHSRLHEHGCIITAASSLLHHHGSFITAASSRLHHHGCIIMAASSRQLHHDSFLHGSNTHHHSNNTHHHSSNTRHHSSNTHHHSSNTRHHSSKIVNDRTLFQLIVSNLHTLCTHLNTHSTSLHYTPPTPPSPPPAQPRSGCRVQLSDCLMSCKLISFHLHLIPFHWSGSYVVHTHYGFLWSISCQSPDFVSPSQKHDCVVYG